MSGYLANASISENVSVENICEEERSYPESKCDEAEEKYVPNCTHTYRSYTPRSENFIDESRVRNEETEECEISETKQRFSNEFSGAECGEPMKDQHLIIDFTPKIGVDNNEQILQKCIDFWDFVKKEPILQKLMVTPNAEYNDMVFMESVEETAPKTTTIDWLMEATARAKASVHAVDQRNKAEMPSRVDEICAQLEEWDRKLPESLSPPGRGNILQRKTKER